MEFETGWTTKAPEGVEVEVDLWGDRGRGDAEVRLRHGLVLGTIADVRLGEISLAPSPDAIAHYGATWVDLQLREGHKVFAFRVARR